MPKTLTYSGVEPDSDGSLNLRCTYTDDGRQQAHYLQFQVGADIAAVAAAAESSLVAAGFSAIPQDALVAITEAAATAWTPAVIAAAEAARAAATPAITVADYISAMEGMYDAKARERHYDNRYTCALRAGYAGPFQAEGAAFALWMDTCNALGYLIMAEVQAGTRPQPTIAALLAELPALTWPT